MVAPALPKDHELITRVYLVRALRGVVHQLCSERLHRKVDLPGRDVLLAKRRIPPERVPLDVSADIAVEIVIAPQTIGFPR